MSRTSDSGFHYARKPHRCHGCCKTIQPGEKYAWWKSIGDGLIEYENLCLSCNDIAAQRGMTPIEEWLSANDEVLAFLEERG